MAFDAGMSDDKKLPTLMSKFWDTLAVTIIAVIIVTALMEMIRPYAGIGLIALMVVVGGTYIYRRSSRW